MSLHRNQTGFSVVELVIIVAIVGVIGFAGYGVHNRQAAKTSTDTSQRASIDPSKANDVSSAPSISSASDLDAASTMLDQNDPATSSNSDSSQLDSQLATF